MEFINNIIDKIILLTNKILEYQILNIKIYDILITIIIIKLIFILIKGGKKND